MITLALKELSRECVHITDISAAELCLGKGIQNSFACESDGHTLYYILDGECELSNTARDGDVLRMPCGTAAFIPSGAFLALHNSSDERESVTRVLSVRFKLTGREGEPVEISDSYAAWSDGSAMTLHDMFCAAIDGYMSADTDNFALAGCVFGILSSLCTYLADAEEISSDFAGLLPAIKHIERHLSENTSISELASMCFISESYFRTKFKAFSGGISPADYRNRLRIEKARELLSSSLWTTDMIADALGFYDTSHFYKIYKKVTGELPRTRKTN